MTPGDDKRSKSKPMAAPTAKAIAKQLDRRQMRRKLILYAALIGAIIFAIVYLRYGKGWGLGGGEGDGPGSGKGLLATVDAGPKRCAIFIASEGITVDGVKMTRDDAITACKVTTGADVIVAGDTRRGDWDDLKAALDAAKIEVFKRESQGAGAPADAAVR